MRSDCPLNYGLEIFGDKWTLLIIRDMMFFNKHSYNEFLTSQEGISTNILAERLNMLERENLISKTKDNTHKQRIIYRLTEKGIDLLPFILEIGLWSDKYGGDLIGEGREVILGEVKRDPVNGMRKIKERLYAAHITDQ